MITLQNINVYFNQFQANEVRALRSVTMHLNPGDFVTIIGSNGAGKSTLLNLIAGSITPTHGDVLLNGTSIRKEAEYKRARYIGRIFQNPLLGTASNMTLEENMAICSGKGHQGLQFQLNTKTRRHYIEELSRLNMGLEYRLREPVGQLSGGQRQALTLLMTVLSRPKLLLLDEHCAALDPANARKVLELSEQFISNYSLTTCMITHNMNHAIQYGNRLLMMDKGEIIADIQGEQKKKLKVSQLLRLFEQARHENLDDDSLLLTST